MRVGRDEVTGKGGRGRGRGFGRGLFYLERTVFFFHFRLVCHLKIPRVEMSTVKVSLSSEGPLHGGWLGGIAAGRGGGGALTLDRRGLRFDCCEGGRSETN